MTRIELAAAIKAASAAAMDAWAAWAVVRDTTGADIRCAEYQAHTVIQIEIDRLLGIIPSEQQARIDAGVRLMAAGRAADRRDNAHMYS